MKPTTCLMVTLLLFSGSLPVFGQSGQRSTVNSIDQSNILQQHDEAIDGSGANSEMFWSER